MNRKLCKGLPGEWWETGNDGARLAMAICRRCPSQITCPDGDPTPHGVIRAGAPFSEAGALTSACPTCGYPRPGDWIGDPKLCARCCVPPLTRFRAHIERWADSGDSNRAIASRVGATPRQIKDARLAWRTRRPHSPSSSPALSRATNTERKAH